jgi:CRP-like cAMP-binding protein
MAPPSNRLQPGSNRLLNLAPPDESILLFANLEQVELSTKQYYARPDEPYRNVLFPLRGVVSVLVPMGEEPPVEAAVIGYEGMVGLPVMLAEGRGPHDVLCQVAGEAWRMPAATFVDLLPECPQLHDLLQRYTLSLMNQIARSSACNRMHDLNQRLARWLLLVQDRVLGDEFVLTQEFLSEMLGVRRPSVSLAAQMLQRAGLITYQWGRIRVLDRRGLEEIVCPDYQLTVAEHEQLFDTQLQA